MLWTRSKCSIKPALEDSTQVAVKTTSWHRPNKTPRWGKQCSMGTSWPSWGRAMLARAMLARARTATLLRLAATPNTRTRQWPVIEMLAVVSQPMPAELEIRELELQIPQLLTTKLTCSTLWIREKLLTRTTALGTPSSKWWWQRNFSTLLKITKTTFRRFPKRSLRQNCANKGKLEGRAILWITCL